MLRFHFFPNPQPAKCILTAPAALSGAFEALEAASEALSALRPLPEGLEAIITNFETSSVVEVLPHPPRLPLPLPCYP